jgi:hypothetical protein
LISLRLRLRLDSLEEEMKVSMVKIFIVFLFALGACSGEDQQPPQTSPPKVVQPIKPSKADIEKPTTSVADQKKPPAEEKPTVEKPAASKADIEKPTTSVADQKKAPVEEKPTVEKPAASPDKPGTAPPSVAKDKKVASEETIATQAKTKEKDDEAGIYLVKKGDTLSGIAARTDVLKDGLKWPILLRLNRDKLGGWAAGENLPDRELPQGTALKVITAREAGSSPKKGTETFWIVNVLSATANAEIVPPAVKLVKQGYPVYIVRANVKGKEYMRLRVGFFKDKSEADAVGKKIKELLNFQESWSTRADKQEYEELGGFFKTIEKH